jgi:hypothetical protein
MTLLGLKFLGALAAKKTDGVYLEIGPLFGSSTNVINKNRIGDAPIHTIDTFEPAPWVRKRLGIDLSRELFNKFTSNINNLVVHEGYAPNVVKDTWKEEIGFYFDDATHGDPGWTDNYEFFSQFFNSQTIICGDDFASGWPDIVRNVYAYAEEWGVKLYVMGRVWAMAHKGEERIIAAVESICPALKGVYITTRHGDDERTNLAACWTWGLHQKNPLSSFRIHTKGQLSGQIVTFANETIKDTVGIDQGEVILKDVNQIYFSFNKKMAVQFCLMNSAGKTQNTKAYKSGQMIDIPDGMRIAALRLSDT